MRAKGDTSATQHGRLYVAKTGPAGAFLRADLAVAAVHLAAVFGAGRSLPCGVGFEDNGAVEDVFA